MTGGNEPRERPEEYADGQEVPGAAPTGEMMRNGCFDLSEYEGLLAGLGEEDSEDEADNLSEVLAIAPDDFRKLIEGDGA